MSALRPKADIPGISAERLLLTQAVSKRFPVIVYCHLAGKDDFFAWFSLFIGFRHQLSDFG
ncbi:MAG: hypothetical protein QF393_13575, partial [Rhodospirillales bacterium]|nr:hypothetical protein [Rhodospirillales bacterium]